jgi:hypothetical protein
MVYIHFGSGSFALECLSGRYELINIDGIGNPASIELAVIHIDSYSKC